MRPRRELVDANIESTYHCISRTVRRAFLLEEGDAAQRGLLRRKAWICSRLRELVSIFAIDLDTFHVMDNHMHLLLTIRPQVAAAWSPQEVAECVCTGPATAPAGVTTRPRRAELGQALRSRFAPKLSTPSSIE